MSSPDIFAQMAEPLSDGTWVNSRIARIVEIIGDYDPMLEVKWLPRDKRIEGADTFQIVDKRINRVAFSVKDESSFDETILNKIFEADMTKVKGSPLTQLEKIDIQNITAKIMREKERMDAEEERNDKVASILKSPLNAYTHDGYRYDRHPTDQPKKVIIDATPGYQAKSKEIIRRREWDST